MSKLALARQQQAAAKKATSAAYQAREQARAALEQAEVPEGSKLADLDAFTALRDADTVYQTAALAEQEADQAVADLVALMGEDDGSTAKGEKPYAGITPITGRFGSEEAAGFKSLGEFVGAVATGDHAKLSKHGVEFKAADTSGQTTGTSGDGGYEIPTLFQRQILEVPTSKAIVRPRATVIPGGGGEPDAKLEIPALNQVGAGNMFGGATVYWEDEEADDDATGTKVSQGANVTVQAKSVRTFITLTNKHIRNAAWLTPVFTRMLGGSLVNAEDFKFLSGAADAAAPTGVRNCDGMIYVNRHTADTVTWEDVLGMQGAMHPDSIGNAVYIANQGLLPVLEDIKDNAGNRVYLNRDFTNDLPDRLDGIPVIYTGKVGAKGDKGDLILVDLSYYLIKDGLDMLMSTSEHVKFLSDRTVIKINRSVDGKGWITGPMTLEDGETEVSPFVGLDVPGIS